jgi:hypothetical protein
LLAVSFASSFSDALAAPQSQPAVREAGIRQLERYRAQLEQCIQLLDQLLTPTPPGAPFPGTSAAIGPALRKANAPPRGPLALDASDISPPALALPTARAPNFRSSAWAWPGP